MTKLSILEATMDNLSVGDSIVVYGEDENSSSGEVLSIDQVTKEADVVWDDNQTTIVKISDIYKVEEDV